MTNLVKTLQCLIRLTDDRPPFLKSLNRLGDVYTPAFPGNGRPSLLVGLGTFLPDVEGILDAEDAISLLEVFTELIQHFEEFEMGQALIRSGEVDRLEVEVSEGRDDIW